MRDTIMDRQIIDVRQENEYTTCQNCKQDLRNGSVPKSEKKFFGDHTHYSKLIGLRLDAEVDIVSHWQCPHCGFTFPRFS